MIFDDVEVPKDRVFLDGDTVGYSEVISDTGWRGHIMHQAFTRAYVKLSFALGLGHLIATHDRRRAVRPRPGEARPDVEHGRADALGPRRRPRPAPAIDEHGVFYPDDRPFLALRGEMPKWLPRCHELLQLIGGGGFMCTPSEADMNGPLRDLTSTPTTRPPAATPSGASACSAWRGTSSAPSSAVAAELYERFYLSDSYRMTGARRTRSPTSPSPSHSWNSSCMTDLAGRGVRYVRVLHPDVYGNARSKEVPVGRLPSSLGYCAASLAEGLDGIPFIEGPSFMGGPSFPDAFAVPDLTTARIPPWEPDRAWVLADLTRPASAAGRALRRVIDRVAKAGYEAVCASEIEFYLLRDGAPYSSRHGMAYTTGRRSDPGRRRAPDARGPGWARHPRHDGAARVLARPVRGERAARAGARRRRLGLPAEGGPARDRRTRGARRRVHGEAVRGGGGLEPPRPPVAVA